MKATSCVEQLRFPNDCNDRNGRTCRGSALIGDDDLSQTSADACLNSVRGSPTFVPNPLKDRIPSSVGVNRRKRTFNDSNKEDSDGPMPSCNSAFLSGLFADIAKANVTHEVEDSPSPCSSPVKRSRLTMTKSISRCGKSFANFSAIQGTESQSESFRVSPVTTASVTRTDSLSYQLHCVSSASSNESENIGKIAFPHLPATVSDSSCTHLASLTRRNSGLQRQETEIISGEAYGWFVNMDDDDETVAPAPPHAESCSSLCDLAFSAATAPKAMDHEAEVEWAKAADTVDDVLGDFF